jgi:hypothetical protein
MAGPDMNSLRDIELELGCVRSSCLHTSSMNAGTQNHKHNKLEGRSVQQLIGSDGPVCKLFRKEVRGSRSSSIDPSIAGDTYRNEQRNVRREVTRSHATGDRRRRLLERFGRTKRGGMANAGT